MVASKVESYLSVSDRGKGIPYGPCRRDDGGMNHGFTPLKGKLSSIESIPEANDDEALKKALAKLNDEKTSIFTIGCVSGPVQDQRGHRKTGYIEFACNCVEFIADARNYFPVFFHFNKWTRRHGMSDDVRFDWELKPAHFCDAGCDGYTCAVIMNTRYCESAIEAQRLWDSALSVLSTYLAEIPLQTRTRIY